MFSHSKLDDHKPTRTDLRQHRNACKVRRMHTALQTVVDSAAVKGVDIQAEMKHLGFDQMKDFYMDCPSYKLAHGTKGFGELGSAYVCFFDYIKFIGFMLCVFLIGSSILALSRTGRVDTDAMAQTWREDLTTDKMVSRWFSTPWTVGNQKNESYLPAVVLGTLVFLTAACMTIYEGRQLKLEADIDLDETLREKMKTIKSAVST